MLIPKWTLLSQNEIHQLCHETESSPDLIALLNFYSNFLIVIVRLLRELPTSSIFWGLIYFIERISLTNSVSVNL